MTLEVKNLSIYAGNRQLIDHVNMSVRPHERVGLIGASGSGKSLITQAILGILPSHLRMEGSLEIDGISVERLNDLQRAQLRGTYMACVFQNPLLALNPVKTVAKNIELPLILHYRLSRKQRMERVIDALGRVGLDHNFMNRYPSQLSGGQAQRVAIAQALVAHPHMMIADEPTTALDSLAQQHIIDVLVDCVDKEKSSLLFVSHDFSVISRTANRCYVMCEGRIIEEATVETLMYDPQHEYTKKLIHSAKELALSAQQEEE